MIRKFLHYLILPGAGRAAARGRGPQGAHSLSVLGESQHEADIYKCAVLAARSADSAIARRFVRATLCVAIPWGL